MSSVNDKCGMNSNNGITTSATQRKDSNDNNDDDNNDDDDEEEDSNNNVTDGDMNINSNHNAIRVKKLVKRQL